MKKTRLVIVAFLAAFCLLTSCKAKTDRLDDIVKDLSADSYSLSFGKTYPDYGITKTSYGAESVLAYADPQDVICPEPWRIRFPKSTVPVFTFPKRVLPTCPTMIPLDIANRVEGVLTKADPTEFAGLKQIKLIDSKNVLLANDQFTGQYTALKADMVDDSILNGLDYNKFLLLEEPVNLTQGFTRYFYGNASLNTDASVNTSSRSGKINFQIFRPVLIGCFDPEILRLIREKFVAWNPSVYGAWQVTISPQDSNIAVLSAKQ